MPRLKRIRGNKGKIILTISLLLISIGFIPILIIRGIRDSNNPYIIEHLALESEDGTRISSFKYTPIGEKSHGGVVVSHRFWGDKLIMHPLSVELVRRGFTVISIDFRGHGASGGQYIYSELINDMKAAVDYFESELPYITEIGLIGHSLGAIVAAELAKAYPDKINATVTIGSLSFDPLGISNLLMVLGTHEPYILEEDLLAALRIYTGEGNVSLGVLYSGDFIGGNNTMGYIGNAEHFLEIIEPSIIYQSIQWFEQAFNGQLANDIVVTEWILTYLSLMSQLGIIIFGIVLLVFFSKKMFNDENIDLKKESRIVSNISKGRLISYYILLINGFSIILYFGLISIPTVHLTTVLSVLLLNIGAGIGTLVLLPFFIIANKYSFKYYLLDIKNLYSKKSTKSLLFGIISALLLIFSIHIFWNPLYQINTLEIGDIWILLFLIIMFFPLILVKEFYFRNIQEKLKRTEKFGYFKMIFIGLLIDNLIIVLVFTFGWFNIVYMPLNLLFFSVWFRISFIQHITTPWVYLKAGRNILGSAIFLSIITAWLAVFLFPTFGYI